jgi:Protein of unknown function, DUF600
MISDISNEYNIIAEIISNEAPVGWSQIRVPAAVESDNTEFSYFYTDQNNNEKWFDIGDSLKDMKIHNALKAIHAQMTVPGQAPWSRCTFTLFPDGKFKFDVEYDD